jgi:hypothetical protein
VLARRGLCVLAALAALAWSAGDATAGFVVDLNTNLTAGAQNQIEKANPALPYYLRVAVDDTALNTVDITLTANLAGSPPTDEIQKITSVLLNVTGITLGASDFSLLSGPANFTGATVDPNDIGLAGDGLFDVDLGFQNSGSNLANLFNGTDVVVIRVTETGLTSANFFSTSVQQGGNPEFGFVAGARVQGLGDNGDGSASIVGGGGGGGNVVPAPPTVILAGIGVLGFGGLARLRRRFTKSA